MRRNFLPLKSDCILAVYFCTGEKRRVRWEWGKARYAFHDNYKTL